MRKFVALVLVVISCLSFVACGIDSKWTKTDLGKATYDADTIVDEMIGNYYYMDCDIPFVIKVNEDLSCDVMYLFESEKLTTEGCLVTDGKEVCFVDLTLNESIKLCSYETTPVCNIVHVPNDNYYFMEQGEEQIEMIRVLGMD